MSNEHESSGPGLLLPAMALGGAGLGMYGLHRAGVFGRGVGHAAADPAVAAAMKSSMKPAGTAAAGGAGSSVADSMAASMRRNPGLTAANTQAGAADAQRSLGLTMDPAVEASMAGKAVPAAPAAAPAVENLGGLNVNTADLGRPGATGRKPRGKAAPAPAQAAPVPAPAPTSPLIGSNMVTRMQAPPPAAAAPGLAHGGMLAGLPRR